MLGVDGRAEREGFIFERHTLKNLHRSSSSWSEARHSFTCYFTFRTNSIPQNTHEQYQPPCNVDSVIVHVMFSLFNPQLVCIQQSQFSLFPTNLSPILIPPPFLLQPIYSYYYHSLNSSPSNLLNPTPNTQIQKLISNLNLQPSQNTRINLTLQHNLGPSRELTLHGILNCSCLCLV